MLIVYETIDASQKHTACDDLYNDSYEMNHINTVRLNVDYATHWLV